VLDAARGTPAVVLTARARRRWPPARVSARPPAAGLQLEDLLRKTNEKLKKFSHVNKKAVEQYRACVEKQTELKKRQRELEESAASIQELVDVLDKRKDEAIQRTFRQVAKHFGEIFAELVPGGWGRLIMQKYADSLVAGSAASATAASQATQATQTAPVEQYVGVAIEVCFDSKKGESHMLQQLSGGQKTLVALALIFAIQRCDPAPFYLFDEILANLDREYRVAVCGAPCAACARAGPRARLITGVDVVLFVAARRRMRSDDHAAVQGGAVHHDHVPPGDAGERGQVLRGHAGQQGLVGGCDR